MPELREAQITMEAKPLGFSDITGMDGWLQVLTRDGRINHRTSQKESACSQERLCFTVNKEAVFGKELEQQ